MGGSWRCFGGLVATPKKIARIFSIEQVSANMDALYTTTDTLKESYMATLYGNPQVASYAPDIHAIQFALSRLDDDHIGTLRISFSVDFIGRNLFTRDRKVLKDYSLLPIEIPDEDGKPYTHTEKVMMAIHILMDQAETEWINTYVKKN